jgi:drug/metabolite transporter (DMT)-like permease
MDLVPLVLVLSAAGAHAAWNFLAKRSGGGLLFVWLCAIAGLALYAPLALIQGLVLWQRVSWAGLGFMAGSGLLHAGYFGALQRAYAEGDLSLVYPLARGTGPLLSVIAALVILGERASLPELFGAALIIVAVLSLARGARGQGMASAVALGILTGAFTAAYTVWDAHAVTSLRAPVIVYYWGAEAARVLLLGPLIWRQRMKLREVWEVQRRLVLGVGVLSPAAYILVLGALTLAPVIVVAPAREISIVFGVLLGSNVLGEGQIVQRVFAAATILVGIALLAVT